MTFQASSLLQISSVANNNIVDDVKFIDVLLRIFPNLPN
jgi:hypothetical protein